MILLTTQSSIISMSSITKAIFELQLLKAEVEENLFLMFLIGTTIQDGGKRERKRKKYIYHFII